MMAHGGLHRLRLDELTQLSGVDEDPDATRALVARQKADCHPSSDSLFVHICRKGRGNVRPTQNHANQSKRLTFTSRISWTAATMYKAARVMDEILTSN
jgi:hypothetical protein